MLTGAGKLPKFVYYLVAISIANPFFVILFVWVGALDEWSALLVTAKIYTALNVIAYGIIIPFIASRELDIPLKKLLKPLLLPFLGASISGLIFYILDFGETPNGLPILIFGFGLMALATIFFMKKTLR